MAGIRNKEKESKVQKKRLLLKKLFRLQKKLRVLESSNSALRNTNRELVHTVQRLKESLREAEIKIQNQNAELCHAIAVKNTFQESFNKLASLMPELTTVLQGTSTIVSKVYGTITDATFRAGETLNMSGFQQMAINSESIKQTSISANNVLCQIRGIEETTLSNFERSQQVSTSPVPSTSSSFGNVSASESNEERNFNTPQNSSESNIRRVNITENVGINPPVQPVFYRMPLQSVLSPVEEQSSQLTNEENRQTAETPVGPSHTEVNNSIQDTTAPNCIDETSLTNNDNEYLDEESDGSEHEPVEEKPRILLTVTKTEVNVDDEYEYSQPTEVVNAVDQKVLPEEIEIINASTSFTQLMDSVGHHSREEAIRGASANGSLTILNTRPSVQEGQDPENISNGMSNVTAACHPSSSHEFPIQITILHQLENQAVIPSPSFSVRSLVMDQNFLNVSNGQSSPFKVFPNVFPRRKKVIPLSNNNTVTGDQSNLSIEGSSAVEESSTGEQSGQSSNRSRTSLASTSASTPRTRRSQAESEDSTNKKRSPKGSSLTSVSTPKNRKSLSRLEDSPSSGTRSAKMRKTRSSPRLSGRESLQPQTRRTRKAVKNYKEPSLAKKLRR